MWFKQAQLFQLTHDLGFQASVWAKKLEPLSFEACLPSFAYSMGWVSPVEIDDAPLVASLNSYLMICLQIEEKILPSTVISQALDKKKKEIESTQSRKVGLKEKMALKDDIIALQTVRRNTATLCYRGEKPGKIEPVIISYN